MVETGIRFALVELLEKRFSPCTYAQWEHYVNHGLSGLLRRAMLAWHLESHLSTDLDGDGTDDDTDEG